MNSFEQGGTIGSINDANIEVWAEGLNGRWREFFGNQNNGLSHGEFDPSLAYVRNRQLPEMQQTAIGQV
jgi:hypothetical protein